MVNGQSPSSIFMRDSECGACYVSTAAQASNETFDEQRFAASQLSFESQNTSDIVGPRKPRKIGPKPIAKVDHGGDGEFSWEPARPHNSRNEFKMLLGHRTAEPASNEKVITRLTAPARYHPAPFNKSDCSRGNGDWPCCAARFAANYADFKS